MDIKAAEHDRDIRTSKQAEAAEKGDGAQARRPAPYRNPEYRE
jgi:hypothetical protein